MEQRGQRSELPNLENLAAAEVFEGAGCALELGGWEKKALYYVRILASNANLAVNLVRFVVDPKPWVGHVLVRPQVRAASWRLRAQGPGSLPVPVTFGPVFPAVAGLAVNLRLVRRHRGAVQPFPAAHWATDAFDTFKAAAARRL